MYVVWKICDDTYMVLNRYKEYKKYADQLKNWVEKLNDDNE